MITSKQEKVFTMEFHPIAGILPLMSDDECKGLVDDIKARGLQEPIALFEGNLSKSQRAVANANEYAKEVEKMQAEAKEKQEDAGKEAGRGRPKEKLGALVHQTFRDGRVQRAKDAGVSESYIYYADKIVRDHPEKAQEVMDGKKTIHQVMKEIRGESPPKKEPKPLKDRSSRSHLEMIESIEASVSGASRIASMITEIDDSVNRESANTLQKGFSESLKTLKHLTQLLAERKQ